jgi:NAD(P)-dependent dehydrogenase (short-subunit alcohol dehydrogenase family)
MAELSGLAAVVTGGGSGIGLAAARLLAERGAKVAVLDLKPGEEYTGLSTDVTDDASVGLAIDKAAESLGGIDILVNNVGIVRVTRAALPHLRASRHAAIVNTCSIAATAGLPQRALYSATNGAVLSLTLAMAADHIHEGIRVNCVNPGTADTPWVGRLLDQADDPAAERAALERRQPMGRLVSADEVAAGIAYLASPMAASVTGTALAIDGGMADLRIRPRS